MAHAHAHTSARPGYYLDQLCTVGACGALGAVAVLMYAQDRLKLILAEQFFRPVLIGGVALLALALVRGAALWVEAGRIAAHDHDHEHGEHCDHVHEHGAACDHDHEHAWTPAKYAVLLVPLVLFLLGLPHEGFSAENLKKQLGKAELEGPAGEVQAKGGKALTLGFRELSEAAYLPDKREYLEGHTVRLKGMYMPLGGDRDFTLFKVRMTCCAADAVPMQVRIISPTSLQGMEPKAWVVVEGPVQFRKVVGANKYLPVITLPSADAVKPTEADPSEFDTQ